MGAQGVDIDKRKVLTALAICLPETEEDGTRSCEECPYECYHEPTGTLPISLIEDIRALLKDEEEPVVRCWDCKHFYFSDNRVETERYWICTKHGFDGKGPNFYCADGERMGADDIR